MRGNIRSNVDRFYEEYSFLKKFPFLGRASVHSVKVRRFDDEFAEATQVDNGWEGLFIFFDRWGQVVNAVGMRGDFDHYLLLVGMRYLPGHQPETTIEALKRIGEGARRVHYAARLIREDPIGKKLVFYKLPRDFKNAAEWLASRQALPVAA